MQSAGVVQDEVSDETLRCRLLGLSASKSIAIYMIDSQPVIRKLCLVLYVELLRTLPYRIRELACDDLPHYMVSTQNEATLWSSCVRKNSPLNPVLNALHTFASYLFKIHFNIVTY
jgi:hypothetical protein